MSAWLQIVISGRKAASLEAVKALHPQRVMAASAAGSQADIIISIKAALGSNQADMAIDLAGMASTPDSLQVRPSIPCNCSRACCKEP